MKEKVFWDSIGDGNNDYNQYDYLIGFWFAIDQ